MTTTTATTSKQEIQTILVQITNINQHEVGIATYLAPNSDEVIEYKESQCSKLNYSFFSDSHSRFTEIVGRNLSSVIYGRNRFYATTSGV